MVVTLDRPQFTLNGMSWTDRIPPRRRCRVRHAVHALAKAIRGGTDEPALDPAVLLRGAEEAAIEAELRIAELENRLEAAYRHTRAMARALQYGAAPSPGNDDGFDDFLSPGEPE